MKTLHDDNETTEVQSPASEGIPVKNNQSLIDELLGGFPQKPMVINEPETIEVTSQPVRSNDVPQEQTQYYKSGKKAGQPKPGKTNKSAPVNGSAETPEELTINGEMLSGALFITLIDLLLPFLICELNNWKSPVKISSDELHLTDKQKKELTPISDAVVKKLNISGNPVWLMIIAMGGIYGVQFASLRALKKQEMKEEREKERLKQAKQNAR